MSQVNKVANQLLIESSINSSRITLLSELHSQLIKCSTRFVVFCYELLQQIHHILGLRNKDIFMNLQNLDAQKEMQYTKISLLKGVSQLFLQYKNEI